MNKDVAKKLKIAMAWCKSVTELSTFSTHIVIKVDFIHIFNAQKLPVIFVSQRPSMNAKVGTHCPRSRVVCRWPREHG